MKSFIRYLLKKLGLLTWVRKERFKRQYRKQINQFKGQTEYLVSFKNIEVNFSLTDPFSATFFSEYFKKGIYEKEGLETLLQYVSNKSIVFDVGANIGYFACFAASYCRQGYIYAFELGLENVNILTKNIHLNKLKNVTVEHCAVSDTTGNSLVQDSAVGNAVLKIINSTSSSDDLISVKSVSLDEYCRLNDVTPDFIKIDVEGAEMKVLKGMKDILTSKVNILVEIHETDLKYFDSSKDEVLDYIRSFGFELRIIGNDVKKNLLVFAYKQ